MCHGLCWWYWVVLLSIIPPVIETETLETCYLIFVMCVCSVGDITPTKKYSNSSISIPVCIRFVNVHTNLECFVSPAVFQGQGLTLKLYILTSHRGSTLSSGFSCDFQSFQLNNSCGLGLPFLWFTLSASFWACHHNMTFSDNSFFFFLPLR